MSDQTSPVCFFTATVELWADTTSTVKSFFKFSLTPIRWEEKWSVHLFPASFSRWCYLYSRSWEMKFIHLLTEYWIRSATWSISRLSREGVSTTFWWRESLAMADVLDRFCCFDRNKKDLLTTYFHAEWSYEQARHWSRRFGQLLCRILVSIRSIVCSLCTYTSGADSD